MNSLVNIKAIEAHKLKININRQGSEYQALRRPKNSFGEVDNSSSIEQVSTFMALLHYQRTGYITKTTSVGSETFTKRQPHLLCLYDDNSTKVSIGDIVMINNKVHTICGIENLQLWDIALRFSLEEGELINV